MEKFNKSVNVTLEELNQVEVIKHLPLLIFYVLIMSIGIVGNLLVLIIYKLKYQGFSGRVYILFLAGTDLSVCVIGIPYHVLDLTWVVIYTNGYLCQVLSFLIGAATLGSVFVLLVVGRDRYLKSCGPLSSLYVIDFVKDRRDCVIVICVAVVLNIPNAIIYGNSSVTTVVIGINGTECFVSDNFQSATFTLVFQVINSLIFIVSVAYLIITYGLIGKKIFGNAKKARSIDLGKTKGCCNCVSTDTDSISSSDMLDEECHEEIQMSVKTDANTNASLTEPKKADETNAAIKSHAEIDLTLENVTDTNTQELSSKSSPKETNKNTKISKNTIRNTRPSGTLIIHEAPGRRNNNNQKRKITIMMLTITIVFIVSYLPFIIITILDTAVDEYWSEMSTCTEIVHNFFLRLYLVNNMANPIIYGFLDKRFRTECVKLIKSLFCFQ